MHFTMPRHTFASLTSVICTVLTISPIPTVFLVVAITLVAEHSNAIDTNLLRRYFLSNSNAILVNENEEDSLSFSNFFKSTFSQHYLLPEDFYLASISPVERPTEEQLNEIQNEAYFEGDILLDGRFGQPLLADDPYPYGYDDTIFNKPLHSSLNLDTYPDKLWTDARIPYMLEIGMDERQRAAIAQAFEEYKENTCIRFVPKQDEDFDYIYIKRNIAFGCSSYVGRAGGNQTVSLEVGKCFTKGIIAHELMHVLGFFHEHSRTDRDKFVYINERNVRPGMLRNFEKYPHKIIDPLGMPYDYGSVMHYHKLAFSKNGKPTIMPRENGAEIGQRYKLSRIDRQKIQRLYSCRDRITTTTTTTTTSASTTQMRITSTGIASKSSSTITTTTAASVYPTSTRKSTEKPKIEILSKSSTSSSTKNPMEKAKKCEDLNAHCRMWQQLGHCGHSRKYMQHYCRRSCNLCWTDPVKPFKPHKPSTCLDKNLFCGYWAKIGECKSESKFMKNFCKKSCDQCDRKVEPVSFSLFAFP